MKNGLFAELVASVRECGAILRGDQSASRAFTIQPPVIRSIRDGFGLTQELFAALLGIRVRVLRNWERGQLIFYLPKIIVYLVIVLLLTACRGVEKSGTSIVWVSSYNFQRPASVSKLAMDPQGHVWAVISDWQRGAVNDFVIRRIDCATCQPILLPPPLLGRASISAMSFDNTGQFWVVSDMDGLIYRRDLNGEWHNYPAEYNLMPTVGRINFTQADLMVDNTGQAWVAPLLGDVFTIDPSTGRETLSGLKNASHFTRDYQERIWTTTLERQTISVQMLDNGTWKTVAQTKEGVMGLAISDQDQVWVKTKSGVSVLGSDENWKDYPYDPTMYNEDYPISPVSNLLVDHRGRVWTGSLWGLYMLDPQGKWRKYDITNAGLVLNDSTLKSNQVNYLLIDKNQRLWIVADKATIMGDLIGSIVGVVDLGRVP